MIQKLGKRVICFLFVLGIDSFLDNINFSCPCFLYPTVSANLRNRPQAASCPRRSEAPGGRGRGLPSLACTGLHGRECLDLGIVGHYRSSYFW